MSHCSGCAARRDARRYDEAAGSRHDRPAGARGVSHARSAARIRRRRFGIERRVQHRDVIVQSCTPSTPGKARSVCASAAQRTQARGSWKPSGVRSRPGFRAVPVRREPRGQARESRDEFMLGGEVVEHRRIDPIWVAASSAAAASATVTTRMRTALREHPCGRPAPRAAPSAKRPPHGGPGSSRAAPVPGASPRPRPGPRRVRHTARKSGSKAGADTASARKPSTVVRAVSASGRATVVRASRRAHAASRPCRGGAGMHRARASRKRIRPRRSPGRARP